MVQESEKLYCWLINILFCSRHRLFLYIILVCTSTFLMCSKLILFLLFCISETAMGITKNTQVESGFDYAMAVMKWVVFDYCYQTNITPNYVQTTSVGRASKVFWSWS